MLLDGRAHAPFGRTETEQTRWGYKYANTPLFSGGMKFSDGGKVVENKMLNAVVEQEGFLAAFTGEERVTHILCFTYRAVVGLLASLLVEIRSHAEGKQLPELRRRKLVALIP